MANMSDTDSTTDTRQRLLNQLVETDSILEIEKIERKLTVLDGQEK